MGTTTDRIGEQLKESTNKARQRVPLHDMRFIKVRVQMIVCGGATLTSVSLLLNSGLAYLSTTLK